MIGKTTNFVKSPNITEPKSAEAETSRVNTESSQTTGATAVVQESKLAQARRGESALTGSMQRAMLDAALTVTPGTTPDVPAPVGTPPPNVGEKAGAERAMKLGDEGDDVKDLQYQLNAWRKENGLPEISRSGVFTKETEDAVTEFQRLMNLKESGIADENTMKRLDLENSITFQDLDGEVKETIRNAYNALQNDPGGRDNLLDVVQERDFRCLISPDAQKAAIHGFMQRPNKNPTGLRDMILDAAILERDANYQNLPDEIKRDVMNTMFYKLENGGLAHSHRNNAIAHLAADPNFGKRSLAEQKQMLESVAANQDSFTAYNFQVLLENPTFQALDSAMQAQVLDIAHNNTMYANTTGQWPEKNDVDNLDDLLRSQKFNEASDEDKRAMLERERKKFFSGDR
jgi:peptidoglycan hydrolase-like protein with peptidoglycan-binding domain